MNESELTVKYANCLDEEILPHITGNMNLRGKRNLLHVIAARQVRMQKQTDWLEERKEFYRKLREE